MAESTPARAADRNLLFGILALQMDFIGRDALIQAMHAWVLDKTKPLGQILQEHKALAGERRTLLEALVQEHLKQHDDDPAQSLAAVSSAGSVREQLKQIADADLHASLAHVSAARPEEADSWATRGSSVGTPTSTGLRFRILRPHARGGLGEVFVASDEELHREVALKQIQDRHADHDESRSRFMLEAEITGGLEHPGIVPVYGLGQYADGRPFYAMRFIKGDSLKDAIAQFHKADIAGRDSGERTLALRQLLGRFLDVCNAIAYAHSRGVLHRDLKPGNIMLGQYGETLVVDWGLAKAVGRGEDSQGTEEPILRPASASGSAETLPGSALGTPAYMSPEQAAGKLELLGPASDVYSLGATLYCLLTGKAPFEGHDVGVTLQRVQRGEFPAPRQVKPEVPGALEAICLKAMALRPTERYGAARALADDVEHWLADEPVSAWPEPWTVRARRWLGRHRTLVTATAAALLVAIVSLAVANVMLTAANDGERKAKAYAQGKEQEASKQRDEARRQEQEATKQRDEARTQKKKADEQLLRAEWLVYAGNISLAQREWEANNAGVARDLLDSCRWDFRGWEHDYLHTLINSNQRTLRDNTDMEVDGVAFSPDGKRVASAGGYGVNVWDLTTGQITFTLLGAGRAGSSVAFSPDGKRLASGRGARYAKQPLPGEVKLWDAQTGDETLTLKGHSDFVTSVAFSPDGKRLVSGSGQYYANQPLHGEVKVWDTMTGRHTLTLKGHTSWVTSVGFSPDGKRLVSGSGDGTVKVWDAQTGQDTLTLKGHTGPVSSVAFGPHSKRLVSGGSGDGMVKVWDAQTGQNTLAFKGHMLQVNSVAFSPDGKRLVSGGSGDGTVKVWDAQTGQNILTLKGHIFNVNSVAFSPDGKRLVSGSRDKTVKVWNAQMDQDTLTLKGHTSWVTSVAFSPDGKRLVSGSGRLLLGEVKVWDATTGQETLTLKGHAGPVSSVAFSPDGKRMVSGSGLYSQDKLLPGEVKVWDATTGQKTLTLKGHTGPVNSVAFSPDGKRLVSGSEDQTVKVWDATTGQAILTLKGHTSAVRSVAFSPDGKVLVSGSIGGLHPKSSKSLPFEVKLWDATTGQETLTLKGHTNWVTSVAFSPDGKRVVSGSGDMTVKLWDATTGQETLTLKGHTSWVTSVAFSPDGKRVVSGSGDMTVKLWDATTGQETLTLKGHSGPVNSVAFSPDGKRLASGGLLDKTVKVWDATTKAPFPANAAPRGP